jgi:hypothetical protein
VCHLEDSQEEYRLKNFIDLHQEMPMPYKTEERLYYDLGNGLPSISMAMDRVNKLEDGTYEVIDWKTGATLTGQKLAMTLQVPTYILIIKENSSMLSCSITAVFISFMLVNEAI